MQPARILGGGMDVGASHHRPDFRSVHRAAGVRADPPALSDDVIITLMLDEDTTS